MTSTNVYRVNSYKCLSFVIVEFVFEIFVVDYFGTALVQRGPGAMDLEMQSCLQRITGVIFPGGRKKTRSTLNTNANEYIHALNTLLLGRRRDSTSAQLKRGRIPFAR